MPVRDATLKYKVQPKGPSVKQRSPRAAPGEHWRWLSQEPLEVRRGLLERMLKYTDRPPGAGNAVCYPWRGGVNQSGIPMMRLVLSKDRATTISVRQLAYWLAHKGEVPPRGVAPSCGNALCVRPSHMTDGKDARAASAAAASRRRNTARELTEKPLGDVARIVLHSER